MPNLQYVPSAYADTSSVYSKSRVQSVFDPRISTVSYRPGIVEGHEIHDTEFEEDVSDLEEFSGRRSEDSVGKRSGSTLSSFDELRTPDTQSNEFSGFNFQLDDGSVAHAKSVEGPVGPHLFRMSTESSRELDVYLTMSPPASPEELRSPPATSRSRQQQSQQQPQEQRQRKPEPLGANPPRTSVPLRTWSPRQVAEWMYSIGFERHIVDTFFINDISGVTLIDLQYEDLKELGISSFGQRHRLWNEIRSLKDQKMAGPDEEQELCFSPGVPPLSPFAADLPLPPTANDYTEEEEEQVSAGGIEPAYPSVPKKSCSSPATPEDGSEEVISPTSGRRRRRHRHREGSEDVISPAESASIVAIEQLLPKPHSCAKGEACTKWQKRQRKLARIATEFPAEMAQILSADRTSPTESGVATSVVVPSVVASSDVLGHTRPSVRLEEQRLRGIASRDPQENVRHFLDFQHLNPSVPKDLDSPDNDGSYDGYPPLSPPKSQEPHVNLRLLPRLTIPAGTTAATGSGAETFSPNRTAKPSRRVASPLSGFHISQQPTVHDMWRMGSPASEMDVPVTAIPLGPVERDFSSSVPPDMRYGANSAISPVSRSSSRLGHRPGVIQGLISPAGFHMAATGPASNFGPPRRSSSTARRHRRQPSATIAPAPVAEIADEENATYEDIYGDAYNGSGAAYDNTDLESHTATSIDADGEVTPTGPQRPPDGLSHEGWMRKRRTRMLRHEWSDAHFRLRGTRLAMHRDDRALDELDCIDVEDYAVAIGASSSKLNSALKRLHLAAKRKQDLDPHAFAFQLTPAAERRGLAHAAQGKTHHFAVRTATERIDWMREIMLARARREKGAEIKSFE